MSLLDDGSTLRRRTAQRTFLPLPSSFVPDTNAPVLASDLGTQRMRRDLRTITIAGELPSEWDWCIESVLSTRTSLEDEVEMLHFTDVDSLRRRCVTF